MPVPTGLVVFDEVDIMVDICLYIEMRDDIVPVPTGLVVFDRGR